MDFLDHGYSPYEYTFNFWNDYLGLSTIVSKNKISNQSHNPNSITESLKATMGLDDAPLCSCVIRRGATDISGHLDCRCSFASTPPTSILDLRERLSHFSPFEDLTSENPSVDSNSAFRGNFGGIDLLGVDRRRKQIHRGVKPEPKICVFCRNNGAPEEVFGSHVLKTPDGRVVCPILRAYTCPLCSANGDNAHTIKYCPLSKDPPAQRVVRAGRAVGSKRMKIF
ncbi:nanos homolog 1-like [Osmerus eperlanus]|uniref:nanos homolog 1-like n=1 Tax=Osmerus eperlanus TaxID=29151 RepID=UPI002E0D2C1D